LAIKLKRVELLAGKVEGVEPLGLLKRVELLSRKAEKCVTPGRKAGKRGTA
jgi:hypothetical protein